MIDSNHVMIDLETLGVNPHSAPVVSVGAVAFKLRLLENTLAVEVVGTFHESVDLSEQDQLGAKIEPKTVTWWLAQSFEAQCALLERCKTPKPVKQVAQEFNAFLIQSFPVPIEPRIWGNGSTFDNALMRQLFERAELSPAWSFWQDSCYRTVKGLAPQVRLNRFGTHHDALDDALSQAHHLARIMTALGMHKNA